MKPRFEIRFKRNGKPFRTYDNRLLAEICVDVHSGEKALFVFDTEADEIVYANYRKVEAEA